MNVYVFAGGDVGIRPGLVLPLEVRHQAGASGFASPPAVACGANPVRIFDGLDRMLRLEIRLGEARTFRLGLLELGVHGDEVAELEAATRAKVSLGLLAGSGAVLRVALDRFGSLHALEVELAQGHLVQVCREGEVLVVRNIQHPLRTDVEVIAFSLPRTGGMARAMQDADEFSELGGMIARALAQDVDLMVESRPGDRLEVIVEKRYLGRQLHRYGSLLGIRYRGAGGRVAYFRHKPEGMASRYFDLQGRASGRVLLRSPVAYHLADPDTRASRAPTIEIVEGSPGAVYRGEEGAPVVAVSGGVIRAVGAQGDRGVVVELQLDDGRVVRYSHLMRTLGAFDVGQRVAQGQWLALIGHTGRVRSNQLRLEIFRPGEPRDEYLDPLLLSRRGDEVSPRRGESLRGPRLEAFKTAVRPWHRAIRAYGRR